MGWEGVETQKDWVNGECKDSRGGGGGDRRGGWGRAHRGKGG